MSVIARRLKEARLRAGLSQEQLGLEAGLEPESASTRMNRYETGTRVPDLELMERVGAVLGVPAAYFYASNDQMAELLIAFNALSPRNRDKALEMVKTAHQR